MCHQCVALSSVLVYSHQLGRWYKRYFGAFWPILFVCSREGEVDECASESERERTCWLNVQVREREKKQNQLLNPSYANSHHEMIKITHLVV